VGAGAGPGGRTLPFSIPWSNGLHSPSPPLFPLISVGIISLWKSIGDVFLAKRTPCPSQGFRREVKVWHLRCPAHLWQGDKIPLWTSSSWTNYGPQRSPRYRLPVRGSRGVKSPKPAGRGGHRGRQREMEGGRSLPWCGIRPSLGHQATVTWGGKSVVWGVPQEPRLPIAPCPAPRAPGSPAHAPMGGPQAAQRKPTWCKNTSPSGVDNEGFISRDTLITKEAVDHVTFLNDYKGKKKGGAAQVSRKQETPGCVWTCPCLPARAFWRRKEDRQRGDTSRDGHQHRQLYGTGDGSLAPHHLQFVGERAAVMLQGIENHRSPRVNFVWFPVVSENFKISNTKSTFCSP